MAFNAALLALLAFVPLTYAQLAGLKEAAAERSLERFTIGEDENTRCWERDGKDGYYSVIDTHNHFRPFGGPPVPFNQYLQWMKDHGILFTTMFGIGQRIFKKTPTDPDCCYYLHCPTFDYKVEPTPVNDRDNALDYSRYMRGKDNKEIHLTLSYTSANLQRPGNITRWIDDLEQEFPDSFGWAGEINVYKHALAANAFFEQPRVNEAHVNSGVLDDFFQRMADKGWPVTLHCDLGCDNYNAFPKGSPLRPRDCEVPAPERQNAYRHRGWWETFLGVHYPAFFDQRGMPKTNFRKIQHLRVWDTILNRFPKTKIVWAHIGLSKELKDLHPIVHVHILEKLLNKHPNLYADISWDVLAKGLLMNYDDERKVERLAPEAHPDLDATTAAFLFNQSHLVETRAALQEIWDENSAVADLTGSGNVIQGPTFAMALYLDLFNRYSDRFLTGTDFVASTGSPDQFPGMERFKKVATGCVKTVDSHSRQVTDTSSINMLLNDEAFTNIVLGKNYFKLIGIDNVYQPPPICGAQATEEGGLTTGALIGIIVGGIVLLLLILALIGFLVFKARGNANA